MVLIDARPKTLSNKSPSDRRAAIPQEHSAAVIFLRNAHGAAAQLKIGSRPVALRFASLAVAFLLFARSPAQDSGANSQPDTIHGTVVNSITHAPIPRSSVSCGPQFAVLTDSEGHFVLTLPSPAHSPGGGSHGVYRLQAKKPGFFEDKHAASSSASSESEVTLYLLPEALIIGRILLSTGEPASRVTVQVFARQVQNGFFRWMPKKQERTNSNGEFRFADLEAGAYKVITHEYMDNDPLTTIPAGQLYGYPPIYYPNAVDFPSASTIQLSAGETFQADISLVRHPYFPVKIPVANPPESNGIRVEVSPSGHHSPGYSLGYDQQKRIIDGSLPGGNYLVEATSYERAMGRSGMVNLSVTGSTSDAPALVLTPNNSISMNVKEQFTSTDPNTVSMSFGDRNFSLHGPRAYLQAFVESADDFQRQGTYALRAPTGPGDESLVFENLPPGSYWLRLDPSLGYVASATMGGLDLLHQPFTIGSGATVPVEITMRDDFAELEGSIAGFVSTEMPAGVISGSVFSGFASYLEIPSAPAYIYCVPLSDSPSGFRQLTPDSSGKFDFKDLAPGTYRFLAFKNYQRDIPYRDPEAMKAYESKGQVIRLSPGQKTSAELQLISDAE